MTRRIAIAVLTTAMLAGTVFAATAQASFGIEAFSGVSRGTDGQTLTQAGAHPDVTTILDQTTLTDAETGHLAPDGNTKDIEVTLPPGVIGNPTATPRCTQRDLFGNGLTSSCVPEAQVGSATIRYFVATGPFSKVLPVYNMYSPPGVAGEFGINVLGTLIFIDARVGTSALAANSGEYVAKASLTDVSQGLPFRGSTLTLWGVPADPAHTAERKKQGSFTGGAPSSAPLRPLMRNPTACTNSPLTASARIDSWQEPGLFHSASFDHDVNGAPLLIDGCEAVPFQASLEATPTTNAADSPTGIELSLNVPQNENPKGLATSDLKSAEVIFPEGMTINPSAAGGLSSCSVAQIGIGDSEAPTCPENSKLGRVEVESPLVDHPIKGGIYLAKQGENKFGSLFAVYLAVDDRRTGVSIKLAGRVAPDPQTGRLTASFDNNPQLPFETLRVELFGGERASLINPPHCGSFAVAGRLTPWSGTASVTSTSSFQISRGPGGKPCPADPFAPTLDAGTANPVAGHYSPFVLSIGREDGSQRLSSIETTLPAGLVGKLAGIPYCPDAALATVSGAEGSGQAQIAGPSCPAVSQVGTVTVGAGAGANPFYIDTGRAYLAGPYKGAPLSLAVIAPAVAGPFDLGSVLVRSAIRVNPETAQLTVVSDPLPTILHGVPLDLRDVRVEINRPDFTLNPTSCEAMAITSTITSVQGASASPSDRFQVGECDSLAFKPKLAISLSGAPTHRGGHPKLRAVLSNPAGAANISRAAVTLPKTEYLENAHIETVCTRVQYGADQCPAQSIYGYAKAWSPLLDQPLQGPVYLRSSDHELPDLVASLDGQIHIDLAGRIDSVHSRIRNTFDFVPDAPVSKFVLTMKGGSKGLLVNNTELCRATPRFEAKFDGQNGKAHDVNPVAKVDCGKKGK